MKLENSKGFIVVKNWLAEKGRKPFAFQQECWEQILHGRSGLVNAPTGYGKTYSVFLGAIIQFINEHPSDHSTKKNNGLQLLWITPLRALAKDIGRAMEEVIAGLGLQWQIAIRNGDTPVAERQRQKKQLPEVLIITPESLHLLLAQKDYPGIFKKLRIIAVDEWHELLGSKRGVQVELAISRIVNLKEKVTDSGYRIPDVGSMIPDTGYQIPAAGYQIEEDKKSTNREPISGIRYPASAICIWGISATIGNLEEAKDVLLSPLRVTGSIISANLKKKINITSILPDEIEKYPWAGHLGIKLADKVLPIIKQNKATLVFINTRGMSERWYMHLLDIAPELAGAIALHHGSIEQELRIWVEEALHSGVLQAVVCTSSLDLGVDFRPVETVIQVGSPKGVARFLQRAGRSGHQPDAESNIWFLPTHSLELLEAAALKDAISISFIESRQPMLLCFDVLLQYMCTLAVSDGFYPNEIFDEIRSTHCFRDISKAEWEQLLQFITVGGVALNQYDDFKKVMIIDGLYKINSRVVAMRHRMHIGTIVSSPMLKVKFLGGGYIGVIEEYFISRLQPGDVFTLAGRNLEFIMLKDMTALVKKSNSKKSIVPSWDGGRMPLSANLGFMLRKKLDDASIMVSGEWQVGSGEWEVGSGESASGKWGVASGEPGMAGEDSNHGDQSGKWGAASGKWGAASGKWGVASGKWVVASGESGMVGEDTNHGEIKALKPLLELQAALSHIPKANELLIEHIETKDGFHLFVYPFEGRLVHEAMAALLAFRISRITPITFSFAMNDYGFELLSDQPIPLDDSNVYELFSEEGLLADIQRSVNASEMARRKFRDIAVIGGLIFQGMPGEKVKQRHLQSSASLLFNVFTEYEPGNLLLRQAYNEVMDQQMDEPRLRNMLQRIQQSNIIIHYPKQLTPFCFPVKVDSMRDTISSEKLEDRVKRMQEQLDKSI